MDEKPGLRFDIEDGPGYLVVHVAGAFSLKESLATLEKAASVARARGMRRILFDASQVTGNPSDIDRYDVGKEAAELFAHIERLAFVRWATSRYTGFAFDVAQNRGLDARAFLDRAEAERWLTGS